MRSAAAFAALLIAGTAAAQERLPFRLDAQTPTWRGAPAQDAREVTLAVLAVRRAPVGLQTLHFALVCGRTTLWQHDLTLYPPDAPLRFLRPLWPGGRAPALCTPELQLGFGGEEGAGWPALEGEVQVTR